MFSGTYHHSLDNKGRIIIPSRFREELEEGFILTRGLDGCLFIFTSAEWDSFRELLGSDSISTADRRAFHRYFFSNAVECVLDKQGRLNLPQTLIGHAGIDKDVVTIGVDTRIEVWSAERWSAYTQGPQFDEGIIAEKLQMLGV